MFPSFVHYIKIIIIFKMNFGHAYRHSHSLPCTRGGLLVSPVSILGNLTFPQGYQSHSQFNCL